MIALIDPFNYMVNNLIEELDAFVETIDFTMVSKDDEDERCFYFH